MVLHHVLERTGPVVVAGPAFEGQAFQPADFHVVYVHRVPGRLEHPVEEPQDDDPADERIRQEVVDPEDHRLGQLDAQDLARACNLSVASQMCSSAPGRWASWSSAWATIGMPPWPTASGVLW